MAAAASRWVLPTLLLVLAILLGALLLTATPRVEGPRDLGPAATPTADPSGPVDELLTGEAPAPRDPATTSAIPTMGRDVEQLVSPVLAGRLTVRVRDDRGTPLAAAAVSVHPIDPEGLRGAPFEDGEPLAAGTTDADGEFQTEAVAGAGTWLRVTASAAGFATAARIVVASDADVELVLGPAGEVRAEVLTTEDGAPEAEPAAGVEVTLQHGDLRLVATTDAAGRVAFPTAPAGTASLRVVTRDMQAVEDGPFEVVAGALVERLIVVAPGRLVEGVVVDEADGAPVAGAEVWIARPGASTAVGTTDAAGRFGPTPAGSEAERQFVAVRAPGFAPALEPVVLRAQDDGAAVSVEVRMVRAQPWRGRVLDQAGEPAAGVHVAWSADGVAGRAPSSATTDEGGWFTIDPPAPPAPGRRVLLVANDARGQAALALRPDDPPPTPLELRLVADAAVGGRLALRDGSPVVGGEVRVVPIWADAERRTPDADDARRLLGNEQGLVAWSAASDAEGRWSVTGVPPGRWQVHARHRDFARWFPAVVDVGSRDVDVGTLVLDDGVTLSGTVHDSNGRALGGARVDVIADAVVPRSWQATTNADGEFELRGLPPGTLRVRARHGVLSSTTASVELGSEDRDDVELEVPAGGLVRLEVLSDVGAPYTGVVVVRRDALGGAQAPGRAESYRAKGGIVEIDGVPAGAAWWSARTPAGHVARTEAPIVVEAGRRAAGTLHLGVPSALEGLVRQANGEPAAVAEIHARHLEGRGSVLATTDLQGRWRFADLVPGRWLVLAYGRGGAPAEREVEVGRGATTTLELDLSPAGKADVEVLDARGRPVAGALVRFRIGGRLVRARGPARTDARGRARVEDLPIGFLEAHASEPVAGEGRSEVAVEPNRTASVVIQLAR